jgi:hypothetical protein
MNSLSELNTYSDTLLPYTDLRAAKIVFDRLSGTPQTISFSTGDQHTLPIGLNISELVLPDEEDVYFEVDVNASPGASATFPTLPAGYTAVEVSTQVYRVSNIQSVADWNLIKNVVINIASNFKTNWNYTATIGYENGLTKSWTVAATWTTYTQMAAAFNSAASFAAVVGKRIRYQAALSSTSALSVQTIGYPLTVRSTLTASALRNKGIVAQLPAAFTITAAGQGLVSNIIPRNYVANSAYAIFAADTPQITDVRGTPSTDTYVFTISSPNGEFGTTTTSSSSYSITGTRAVVNSSISNIRFYSTKNLTTNTTYTISITRNGSNIFSGTKALNYSSTATITGTTTLTYSNPGNYSVTFTPLQKNYALVEYLVVGGGGGGGTNGGISGKAGGGGGGGAVVYGQHDSGKIGSSASISVGSGGAPQFNGLGSSFNTGNTEFLGVFAPGGYSGFIQNGGSTNDVFLGVGGTSGTGYEEQINSSRIPNGNNAGGTARSGTGFMTGGGGGGAGGVGQNGQVRVGGNGGTGLANSISGTSRIYAYGGGGGISWDGSPTQSGTPGTSGTTPGSGGRGGGGLTTGGAAGQGLAGIVILRITY